MIPSKPILGQCSLSVDPWFVRVQNEWTNGKLDKLVCLSLLSANQQNSLVGLLQNKSKTLLCQFI